MGGYRLSIEKTLGVSRRQSIAEVSFDCGYQPGVVEGKLQASQEVGCTSLGLRLKNGFQQKRSSYI